MHNFSLTIHRHVEHCKACLLLICMFACLDGKQSRQVKQYRHLNANQKSVLMQWFTKDPYPTLNTLRNLSDALGVDKLKLYNWFNWKRSELRRSGMVLPRKCELKDILIETSASEFGQTTYIYIYYILLTKCIAWLAINVFHIFVSVDSSLRLI